MDELCFVVYGPICTLVKSSLYRVEIIEISPSICLLPLLIECNYTLKYSCLIHRGIIMGIEFCPESIRFMFGIWAS